MKDYFRRGFQTDEIPLNELSEYLSVDLRVTKDLYWRLMEEYDKPESQSLVSVRDLTNEVCKCLTKMYMNGFKIDKDALAEVRENFEIELTDIEGRLQKQVKELMGDTPINLNSPEQVSQVIYSRILFDKKKWAIAFDNVDGADDFKKIVRENSGMMVKTKASICQKCHGNGKVYKIKKMVRDLPSLLDALSVTLEGTNLQSYERWQDLGSFQSQRIGLVPMAFQQARATWNR